MKYLLSLILLLYICIIANAGSTVSQPVAAAIYGPKLVSKITNYSASLDAQVVFSVYNGADGNVLGISPFGTGDIEYIGTNGIWPVDDTRNLGKFANPWNSVISKSTMFSFFGSTTGNGTSTGFGSYNIPVFTLAGDPAIQGRAYANVDFTAYIQSCNPYSSGSAMSLKVATINSNAWDAAGCVGTNSDNQRWGWDKWMFDSWVTTPPQGPIGDEAGVNCLVNNGNPIAIVQNVAAAVPSTNFLIRTNYYVLGLGAGASQEIISNISFWSPSNVVYSNYVNGVFEVYTNLISGGDGAHVAAIQGNYPCLFTDPNTQTTYFDYYQGGVFYPTSPLAQHILTIQSALNNLIIGTNVQFISDGTNWFRSTKPITAGPNANALTTYDSSILVAYLNGAQLDPTKTNQGAAVKLNGFASTNGYLFNQGAGMRGNGGGDVIFDYQAGSGLFQINSYGIKLNAGALAGNGYNAPNVGNTSDGVMGTGYFQGNLIAGANNGGGGFTSYATNTASIAATGWTNLTATNYWVSITAGASMAVKDGNGNQFLAPVVNNCFPMKPNWRLTGTAITGIAIQQ